MIHMLTYALIGGVSIVVILALTALVRRWCVIEAQDRDVGGESHD